MINHTSNEDELILEYLLIILYSCLLTLIGDHNTINHTSNKDELILEYLPTL